MRISPRFVIVPLSLCIVLALGTWPQGGVRVTPLLEKELSAYAGRDLVLRVGQVVLPSGARGSKHRHPGPTFVYVLEGAVEVELEGTSAKTYRAGDMFYEQAHQLHISTKNVSQTEPARTLAGHLSHEGEKLSEPEQ